MSTVLYSIECYNLIQVLIDLENLNIEFPKKEKPLDSTKLNKYIYIYIYFDKYEIKEFYLI